jgi:hypothetical protein
MSMKIAMSLFCAGLRERIAADRLLKRSLVDAMQGENRFESGAYTPVREHFESIFNAAARRQRLFRQPADLKAARAS